MLHLVGDESRNLRRHPKVDLRTDQGAGVENEGGAGIGCRCRPRLVLGKDTDPERLRRPDPGHLAPEGRRTLSHALDNRLELRIHVKIRRETRFRLPGEGQVGPGCHRAGSEEHPNAAETRCPHAVLPAAQGRESGREA